MTLDHASAVVRRASVMFLVMIIISGATWRMFSDIRFVDFKWRHYIGRYDDARDGYVRIPINPPGWSFELEKRASPGKRP